MMRENKESERGERVNNLLCVLVRAKDEKLGYNQEFGSIGTMLPFEYRCTLKYNTIQNAKVGNYKQGF